MWHSTSVPMGWEVIGLYAADSLGYEIVASDRSGDSLLAGGGADGRVRMTRFPSVPGVHCQSILAHPGGVNSLRFAKVTSRDKGLACLITSGAADSTLLQWRVSHGGVKKRRKGNIEELAEEMRVLVHAMKSSTSKKRQVQFESKTHWRKAMAAPMKREPEHDIAPKLNKALQQGVLRLEYVHGYRGQDCSGNICPGDDGRHDFPNPPHPKPCQRQPIPKSRPNSLVRMQAWIHRHLNAGVDSQTSEAVHSHPQPQSLQVCVPCGSCCCFAGLGRREEPNDLRLAHGPGHVCGSDARAEGRAHAPPRQTRESSKVCCVQPVTPHPSFISCDMRFSRAV
jgi:hypothetical protein